MFQGRKLLGIALSFFIFPKVFTLYHAAGVILVLGAGVAHSVRPQLANLIANMGSKTPFASSLSPGPSTREPSGCTWC